MRTTTATTTTEAAGAAAAERRGMWAAGLVVAAGAGVATAHGLYQVAAAANVPAPIAWLYPLITDGLALVGYAATSRLTGGGGGRRYAAGIVVLAAGLSGLAQAVYLAGGITHPSTTSAAPVGLRFGVGAWPAIAAALTAHLLHQIGTRTPPEHTSPAAMTIGSASVQPATGDGVQPYNPVAVPVFNRVVVQPPRTTRPPNPPAVQPVQPVQPERSTGLVQPPPAGHDPGPSGSAGGGAGARDRARHAAQAHYVHHGALPTVTELMHAAQVARGTAGPVLKELRANRAALHVVNAGDEQEPDQ